MRRERSRQKQKINHNLEHQQISKLKLEEQIPSKLIKKYHKFIRESSDEEQYSHKQKLPIKNHIKIQHKDLIAKKIAKQQYQKLYKQYVIVDLSRYQSGQIGCRWRTQNQVVIEKGQKYCGSTKCNLQSQFIFQMNFGYLENSIKKNALVKVSVCKECAQKLNYKKKLKVIQQIKRKLKKQILVSLKE